ncbi:lipase family protein [Phyllobacterium phragmitis]|nr:lipase family protein [Phyllobacterium phragmitis]
MNWKRTAAIVIGLIALAALSHAGLSHWQERFYYASVSKLAAGDPGSIIHRERMNAGIEGAEAWRVLYRSTGLEGEAIAVSGVVIVPVAEPPADGFPVVAWAHPTTGIAQQCAPSFDQDIGRTIPGLKEMVKKGFVVAATDYVGLGTAGPHPYLVGKSAAHSVLNSVRAAGGVTRTSRKFVVWGHSQGGHAALWTGQLSAEFAPELIPLGVAAAAPASNLSALFEDDHATAGGKAFTTLALLSWSKIYGLDLGSVIEPGSLASARVIGKECMTNRLDLLIDGWALRGLAKSFLKIDPTKVAPWSGIIKENTPSRMQAGLPVLITQGTRDSVVLPPVTRNFARGLCKAGTPVEMVEMDADHLSVATLGADVVVQWIADRLSGYAAASGCSVPAG